MELNLSINDLTKLLFPSRREAAESRNVNAPKTVCKLTPLQFRLDLQAAISRELLSAGRSRGRISTWEEIAYLENGVSVLQNQSV